MTVKKQKKVDNYYHYVFKGVEKRLYMSQEKAKSWKEKYESNWQVFMIADHEQTTVQQIQYVGARSF